jgi:hypothetical protein
MNLGYSLANLPSGSAFRIDDDDIYLSPIAPPQVRQDLCRGYHNYVNNTLGLQTIHRLQVAPREQPPHTCLSHEPALRPMLPHPRTGIIPPVMVASTPPEESTSNTPNEILKRMFDDSMRNNIRIAMKP